MGKSGNAVEPVVLLFAAVWNMSPLIWKEKAHWIPSFPFVRLKVR
jgi:hypothetical protein